jgi:signal transduction histidine kinase
MSMKTIILLITSLVLLTASQYRTYGQAGLAQAYQQDTATITLLLESAKNKELTDTTTAKQKAFEALALAQKHNDAQCILKAYLELGNISLVHDKIKSAQNFYLLALSVESKINDVSKNKIYSAIANTYAYMGKTAICFEYLQKNYAIAEASKDVDELQKICSTLSLFYGMVNEHEKATQFATKSIEYAALKNNIAGIIHGYRSLAKVYLKSKNYNLALQSSEKSISYIDKIDQKQYAHQLIYLDNGIILRECGYFEKSLVILKKSLEICQKVHDESRETAAYIEIADCYNKMNDLKNAEIYYLKSEKRLDIIADIDVLAFLSSYAKFKLKKGKYDEAIELLERSNTIAINLKRKTTALKNYKLLSEAYEKKGNDHLSLLNLKKSNVLQDSIFSEENTKRITDAEFKYNLAKSEEDLKTIKTRQFYTVLISVAIILGLFIAFLIYFLRSKDQKNKYLLEKTQMLTETTLIIKDKNRQLEESNEILRQFAFISAHDLKEPLRNISSFTNIIQKRYLKILPPEANEYMGFVTVGVKRMESLLNALLEFSSVLIDDDTAHKKNDITLVLNDVFQHNENLINEKKAVIQYSSVFPTISMNEAHLKQILSNLVHNALKFSKTEAKIEIGYETTTEEFILSVKDEGIGMDKSYGGKIFKLFQRLDRVTHKESVGIGLTLSKNIMDKYAGRIWFDSVINEGSTFYLAFPKSMISDIPATKQTLLIQSQNKEGKGIILGADLLD